MEDKIFTIPEGVGRGSSVDPNMLLAMMNNGNGFGGGNNNWLWMFFLFILFGWGGRGFGNNASTLDANAGRELLMQAIQGNASAINQLAANLNCDGNAIRTALNSLQSAVQMGNQQISSQLAQCCCDNKTLSMQQGYENQIATLNQTNQLGSKMDGNTASITAAIANQTSLINDKFCALEMREMQGKIDALAADKAALMGQISQSQQNQYFAAMLAPLQNEIAGIKAAMPPTVAVPYPQLTAVPSAGYSPCGSVFSNGMWT